MNLAAGDPVKQVWRSPVAPAPINCEALFIVCCLQSWFKQAQSLRSLCVMTGDCDPTNARIYNFSRLLVKNAGMRE